MGLLQIHLICNSLFDYKFKALLKNMTRNIKNKSVYTGNRKVQSL